MSTETFDERIAREKREMDVLRARLLAIGAGIAATPGFEGYSAIACEQSFSDASVDLHRATGGRVIHLTVNRYDKTPRISISGRYPRGPKGEWLIGYREHPPSITVGFDRPAVAIAKEILRRFLPDYETLFQAVEERQKASDQARLKLLAAGQRAAALLGAKFDADRVEGQVELTAFTPHYLKVKTYGATFDVSVDGLTFEQLTAIVALVKGGKELAHG